VFRVAAAPAERRFKQERHKRQAEVRHLHFLSSRLYPTVEEIFEDPPEFRSDYSETDSETEFETEEPQDNPDEIEPGDRVFMTTVHDPAEFIRATATTSQRLAEAFTRNSAPPKSFHESVPSQFHDFEEVFSKVSFDALWTASHGTMLLSWKLGAKASSTKVYPLSPNEQTELDAFIEENLASGRSVPLNPQWQLRYSSSRRRMEVSNLVQDYRGVERKDGKEWHIHFRSSPTSLTDSGVRATSPSLMSDGDTTTSASRKVIEWKAAFRTNEDFSNPWSCSLVLTNSPATFQTMMNKIFQDLISRV